jgi:hypothetical protein
VAITNPFATHKQSNSGVGDNEDPTSAQAVTRQDLAVRGGCGGQGDHHPAQQ